MTARHMRSHSRSTSVTRSISPFLATLNPDARRASWISPARRTISVAVARKTGSGILRLRALDHHHFHAALRRALQHHLVHEAAHEEDAAPARLEQVLRRERIGQRGRIEAAALVAHLDGDAGRLAVERRELDVHALA